MFGNIGSGRRAIIDMRAYKTIVLRRRTMTEIAKRIGCDVSTVQRYRDEKITEDEHPTE